MGMVERGMEVFAVYTVFRDVLFRLFILEFRFDPYRRI